MFTSSTVYVKVEHKFFCLDISPYGLSHIPDTSLLLSLNLAMVYISTWVFCKQSQASC